MKYSIVFLFVFLCVVFDLFPTSSSRSSFLKGAEARKPILRKRVFGGQDARTESYPFQVFIRKTWHYCPRCGGVIINANWILTSARCAYNVNESALTVFPGLKMLPKKVTELLNGYKVKQVVLHEDFSNLTLASDLALLELETPIPLGGDIQAIAELPKQGVKVAVGTKCMFLGWGISGANLTVTMVNNKEQFTVNSMEVPYKLQEAEMTITSDAECVKKMNNVFWLKTVRIDEKIMICGDGQNTKVGCSGDNGAPVVCRDESQWVLQGLGSWGDVWCRPYHYSVLTRISEFADWIKQKTQ